MVGLLLASSAGVYTYRQCISPAYDADDETAAEALVEGLERLNESLNVPRLRDCVKVDRTQFATMVEKMALDALASGSPQNNPVIPTAEQIVELYWAAW